MADRLRDLPFVSSWLQPESDETDIRRYASTLRQRKKLIVGAVLLALIAAGVYVKTATPVYTAQAQLLVSPLTGTAADTLAGLGLIIASADPTQDVETGASVVTSIKAAQLTKQRLKLADTPQQILDRVSVEIISESDIVAVTATATNAAAAAALANTFAQSAISVRTTEFQNLLTQKITLLKSQIVGQKASATVSGVQGQIGALEGYRGVALPDMNLSEAATPPTGRTSPRDALSLGAALFAGLIVGILGAFGLEAFDSTLRREDQLSRLFRLPVLARIPFERKRRWLPRRRQPPGLTPAATEAYRMLRVMLLAATSRTGDPVRSIFVTSSQSGEGKSTVALNLATSLASAGAGTILIEADMRKPTIGDIAGIGARYGLAEVLTGRVDLHHALVTSPTYPQELRFLLGRSTNQRSAPSGDLLFLPTVAELFTNAERLAEYIVIDSPPLLAVIDALDLACDADAVLLVARIGETNTKRLAALGELLDRAVVEPVGIALIGGETPGGAIDYQYTPSRGRVPDIGDEIDEAVEPVAETPRPSGQ
jgi:succinoglycan biosynthesis transport protein ExoP